MLLLPFTFAGLVYGLLHLGNVISRPARREIGGQYAALVLGLVLEERLEDELNLEHAVELEFEEDIEEPAVKLVPKKDVNITGEVETKTDDVGVNYVIVEEDEAEVVIFRLFGVQVEF